MNSYTNIPAVPTVPTLPAGILAQAAFTQDHTAYTYPYTSYTMASSITTDVALCTTPTHTYNPGAAYHPAPPLFPQPPAPAAVAIPVPTTAFPPTPPTPTPLVHVSNTRKRRNTVATAESGASSKRGRSASDSGSLATSPETEEIIRKAATRHRAPRFEPSWEELNVLERIYNENPKPTLQTRQETAAVFKVHVDKITTWFSNRHNKSREICGIAQYNPPSVAEIESNLGLMRALLHAGDEITLIPSFSFRMNYWARALSRGGTGFIDYAVGLDKSAAMLFIATIHESECYRVALAVHPDVMTEVRSYASTSRSRETGTLTLRGRILANTARFSKYVAGAWVDMEDFTGGANRGDTVIEVAGWEKAMQTMYNDVTGTLGAETIKRNQAAAAHTAARKLAASAVGVPVVVPLELTAPRAPRVPRAPRAVPVHESTPPAVPAPAARIQNLPVEMISAAHELTPAAAALGTAFSLAQASPITIFPNAYSTPVPAASYLPAPALQQPPVTSASSNPAVYPQWHVPQIDPALSQLSPVASTSTGAHGPIRPLPRRAVSSPSLATGNAATATLAPALGSSLSSTYGAQFAFSYDAVGGGVYAGADSPLSAAPTPLVTPSTEQGYTFGSAAGAADPASITAYAATLPAVDLTPRTVPFSAPESAESANASPDDTLYDLLRVFCGTSNVEAAEADGVEQ